MSYRHVFGLNAIECYEEVRKYDGIKRNFQKVLEKEKVIKELLKV